MKKCVGLKETHRSLFRKNEYTKPNIRNLVAITIHIRREVQSVIHSGTT